MTSAARITLSLVVAITGIALPVMLGGPASPPAVAGGADEIYRVPDSGRFKLAGRGYGHGIGMSQFGAQGMGLLGKSYRQILNFYYPGTNFDKTAPNRSITVSLSGVVRRDYGTAAVAVRPRSGLRFINQGKTFDLPGKVGGSRVDVYRVLRTKSAMKVRAYANGDSREVKHGLKGVVRFATSAGRKDSRVTVVSAGGSDRTYRGFLDVRRAGSTLLPVSNLLVEHYLRSVVSAEVPGSWTNAALRAQAVAARSYALLAQVSAKSSGRRYDICDTTNCQVYGPIRSETAPESKAVRATARQFLKGGGKPAFTMFSSANGGYTVSGSRGYLVAKRDPYDGVVTGAANWGHSWDKTVSARTIQNAWPTIGKLKAIKVWARDGNGQWGGRVLSLALVGGRDTVRISGDSFRWGLGLKSTWWKVKNA